MTSREFPLNKNAFSGKSVLYVMSRDQRAHDNFALLAAQQTALEHNVPLLVLFVLKHVPGRSREHYQFMMQGLKDVAETLARFNIGFILHSGEATEEIKKLAEEVHAGAIYFDFSPLKGPRAIAKKVAKQSDASVVVVDTHNIIPAWVVSNKQEFAAHTMRSKVQKLLEQFLLEPEKLVKHPTTMPAPKGMSLLDAQKFIATIPACGIKVAATPGEKAAKAHLKNFIARSLKNYAVQRNDISADFQSGLSPYLHFGHISSLRVVLEVMKVVDEPPLLLRQNKLASPSEAPRTVDGMNALFEEMIVRKELADNFCLYNEHYKSLAGAPQWARISLQQHQQDPRDFVYNRTQWEQAATHDAAWNAAQTELTRTGKLHGYLRMYWAKKILEWSARPEEAVETAVYLNDKYSIDGGDPNGYVGILWSVAGLHDRPWFERPVYGKIRYMNEAGLRRKFDVAAYIARVSAA